MDLRSEVVAILVGGNPAPGINGIISSATIEALNSGLDVIGYYDGFAHLKVGDNGHMKELDYANTTRIFDQAGSILRTSTARLETELHCDNALRVLEYHRVRYLITIGGVKTASSAMRLEAQAKATGFQLNVVHVPKTIFNDLPLGGGAVTFGHSTALEQGVQLVRNFITDARTMTRWYLMVVKGITGHLGLGIGKAAAATLSIIPEQFENKKISFAHLCDLVEATVYKRRCEGKNYGVVIIAEGVTDLVNDEDTVKYLSGEFGGKSGLGLAILLELKVRLKTQGITNEDIITRNIGNELRSAAPNVTDISLTRDLGFMAVTYLLSGKTGDIVCENEGQVRTVRLSTIVDVKSGESIRRGVDTKHVSFTVAQRYMISLQTSDFVDAQYLADLAAAANMTVEEFKGRFEKYAETSHTQNKSHNNYSRNNKQKAHKLQRDSSGNASMVGLFSQLST